MNFIKKYGITIALFAMALVLFVIGIVKGQPMDVLQKAVRICLECVGIG